MLVEDDADAERLTFELLRRGYQLIATVEQTKLKRLATTRLKPPGLGAVAPVVDLLFQSSGIEPEIVRAAERIEVLPGVILPVARIPHLVAMKVLARDDRRRPQDFDDLHALLDAGTASDADEARSLLGLIALRGASRGRALAEGFEQLLQERSNR